MFLWLDFVLVKLSDNLLVFTVEFFFLSCKNEWTHAMLSAAQRIREDVTYLSIWGNAKCSFLAVLGRETQSPRSSTCKHQFSHASASSNWTSLLNSLCLERRGNINCIVLHVKETKPIVKLVTRVLWQLNRKLYMPVKWAFYHWHRPKIPSLAELLLKSKESCPSK